ncbi:MULTISPECIES: DUF3626 domain-containing protein [Bacillus cereus group]|uniref:DUF3626 domain-containing protein n=1 Tax=Bacillus cereus group TaxID=86661 RepID=UPI0007FB24D0|nr:MULTISPECIES: DUF3626 domain-containing protein [Bacillus cereus group]MCP1396892.1 hypothetical protein [Bacillus cereus]MED2918062.1 DUF3626 domain-containing protein [Bacillus thuringiensis]MED2922531.1 DUF3626 domain-containing protein [Bacillus thuringiensis]MED3051416.1 DUF3626 domain-containing protein [Bacillus thuringiensis]OBW90355.1 hypothetical protein A9L49_04565 [Bacillus cereus]
MELSRSQLFALEYISKYAENEKREAKATINHILKMSNITDEIFEEAVANLKSHARIALHFHPDRLDSSMKSVAEALFEQGVYKSQFETLLSNGSVSAYPGGERDLWEKRIFGGAYQLEGVTNEQRPKYGALNLMLHPDGPAPRFGSCYFLLSPKVSSRSTYTYLDSHQDPKEKGTYEEFDMILAALLEETFVREFAIGEGNLTPTILINHLLANLKRPFIDLVSKEPARNLNHYIEAQIHGEISLKEDVEALVADPSFKGTDVGKVLEEICLKYAIDLYWHIGFVLAVDEVPMDFRGSKMPSLARRIARNHCIDANIIGSAVVDLKRNPLSWSDRGTYEEVLQELKLLWHVLVRFGKPNRK